MLRISELYALRDRLVYSLDLWGRGGDGFYRSSPYSRSTPSFTNTGIVLQAFNESQNNHLAHSLASRLLDALPSRYAGVFPHEKAPQEAHVMCNAWAAFAILESFPNRVGELAAICDWFLNTQREDNSWPLLAGGETHEPIVTGYAVSALQQLHRCLIQASQIGPLPESMPSPSRIAKAIELAVNYLLDARPASVRQEDLYLWPASIGLGSTPRLSLGTSALCMHVLAKWGRYRGRSGLVDGVASTFKRLVISADGQAGSHIDINGHRLAVWDELHLNEGSINYQWYFFAPISAVTLLQFSEHPEFEDCSEFRNFVRGHVDWIQSHVREVDSASVGISGSETLAEPKVWATGLSVIVLSRILERRDLFRIDELRRANAIERQIVDVVSAYQKPPRKEQIDAGSIVVVLIVAASTFKLASPALGQEDWPKLEGYLTIILLLLSIAAPLLGLTIRPLRRRLRGSLAWILDFSARFLRAPKAMKNIDRILGQKGRSIADGTASPPTSTDK